MRRAFPKTLAAAGLMAVAVLLAGIAWAANDSARKSRVPMPNIPKALKEAEPGHAERLRNDHRQLLVHKRDQTMRQGIRTAKDSLKECVACHAVPGPDKLPVSAQSPEHFCRVCHDYAAVSIDCFSCHASRPPKDVANANKGGSGGGKR
ncbi:MAG: Hdr-like menaquinol oxidoreductase cytochrome c subunit [Rhodospirillales bacterium]|jgi:hypothetical protein|nr:Hdr-like menaquinol oxidoreductase cytochrome c subunit [Rhodospirillaceae bacterium]MDP6428164.1 Hdr-like menaquinol oxidoreductase cytochrome c subunit [Rhodospirillales bacterium]MDP6642953.1 Hdr-like menaquinol oxidoreductase cytochrome c subunit [Rhodospirillales bacterium]